MVLLTLSLLSRCLLQLIARETKTTEKRSNHAYVTIDLTDVNDNKPVFAEPSYTAYVSETAVGGTPVIRITVSRCTVLFLFFGKFIYPFYLTVCKFFLIAIMCVYL